MIIHGIVLAGGRSRRMEGPDKAFVSLGDRPLIAHVLERLAPQCAGLVVSRNGDPAALSAFRWPVVADDVGESAGPLAGLVAALDWIATHRPETEFAASCPVDTPFLPGDFVSRLAKAARRHGASVACASSAGRRHPVTALWAIGTRHAMRDALTVRRERRVSVILDLLGSVTDEWPAEPRDPFFNINTPRDLEQAHQWVENGKT